MIERMDNTAFDLKGHLKVQEDLHENGVIIKLPTLGNLEVRVLSFSADSVAATRIKAETTLRDTLGREPTTSDMPPVWDATSVATILSARWSFTPNDDLLKILRNAGKGDLENGQAELLHSDGGDLARAIFEYLFKKSMQIKLAFIKAVGALENLTDIEIERLTALGKD